MYKLIKSTEEKTHLKEIKYPPNNTQEFYLSARKMKKIINGITIHIAVKSNRFRFVPMLMVILNKSTSDT
jgi:hypothetical protein